MKEKIIHIRKVIPGDFVVDISTVSGFSPGVLDRAKVVIFREGENIGLLIKSALCSKANEEEVHFTFEDSRDVLIVPLTIINSIICTQSWIVFYSQHFSVRFRDTILGDD